MIEKTEKYFVSSQGKKVKRVVYKTSFRAFEGSFIYLWNFILSRVQHSHVTLVRGQLLHEYILSKWDIHFIVAFYINMDLIDTVIYSWGRLKWKVVRILRRTCCLSYMCSVWSSRRPGGTRRTLLNINLYLCNQHFVQYPLQYLLALWPGW